MSTWRILAVSFTMAVGTTTSPATAADEWSSFTDRVQQSQAVHVTGARLEQVSTATAEPSRSGDAASFIPRVVASQGIRPSRPGIGVAHRAPEISADAISFVSRVMAIQGIGPARDRGGSGSH